MSSILAVDPGKNVGVAHMEYGGEITYKGVIPFADFGRWLADTEFPELTAIVVEGFQLYGHRAVAQQGSSMEAAQCIGECRGFARMRSIRFVQQQPESRKLGAKFVQYKLGRSHTPDDISAWLHGVYYLKGINQLTTALETKLRQSKAV